MVLLLSQSRCRRIPRVRRLLVRLPRRRPRPRQLRQLHPPLRPMRRVPLRW